MYFAWADQGFNSAVYAIKCREVVIGASLTLAGRPHNFRVINHAQITTEKTGKLTSTSIFVRVINHATVK